MTVDRRHFLGQAGLAAAAGGLVVACMRADEGERALSRITAGKWGWDDVRALFPLSREWIDMSAMLLTSHPKPVAAAIEQHRRALDENPIVYLTDNNKPLQNAARAAAGRYFGAEGDNVALTDSTTMSVALVYQGLKLRPGQEMLTSDKDYYVTHESLRLAALRNGASVRRIHLYDDIAQASQDAIVDRYMQEIRPQTRVLTVTWVHSSTGLKIPVKRIGEALARVNAGRDEADRVLFCIDGVHGFGNQDARFDELGADFLMSGCHKWIYGPRGTGVIFGTSRGWAATAPVIPTFLDSKAYDRWKWNQPTPETTAVMMTPGGFKPFEHLWALGEAFALHEKLGKARVAKRTAELASQLKEGLRSIPNVKLHTPLSPELSAGIVSFDVGEASPWQVIEQLREKRVLASVAPYAQPHVRLTPSVRNSPDEIEAALRAVRALA